MFTLLRNNDLAAIWLLCALSFAALPPAMGAPQSVEGLDQAGWRQLVTQVATPAIVVFTSETCAYCPGAIKRIGASLAASRSRTQLLIVSVDGDDAALLQEGKYAGANRLFVFRGKAQAVQYAVNPAWRGMTPYMAYLSPKAPPRFVLGEPDNKTLQGWMAGR